MNCEPDGLKPYLFTEDDHVNKYDETSTHERGLPIQVPL